MPVEISKKFRFESAHWLPGFPEGHKCRRLHGHSFELEIIVQGEIHPQTGVLVDYGEIKKIVQPFVELLDHRCINEIGKENDFDLLKNPTSENLAKWFFHSLEPLLKGLSRVKIYETCTSSCTYYKNV